MSKAESAKQKPIAAFVGMDWADQKHYNCFARGRERRLPAPSQHCQ
jgi:hypothetical protein